MKSTVVKPSNGQSKNKKSSARSQSQGWNLRRLTKRQRTDLVRIGMIVFLVIFTFSIVGGMVAWVINAPK